MASKASDKAERKQERRKREKRGRRAELYAEIFLRSKGYKIVARRFKTRRGEIDLIARKGQVLAIIEVKQRRELIAAEDSITAGARRRIMNAARDFVARNPNYSNLAVRYDAIFVLPRFKIVHKPDAWRPY